MKLPFSWVWYKFNNHLGSFPSKRNMKTIEIFDSIIILEVFQVKGI